MDGASGQDDTIRMAGGRIPDSFIQELLARTDIVEVIGSRIELKRAGKEYKGLSPFTHEKTPSFFVSPAKQMFFDFSSGKNGTAISFLMEYDRLGFVEAVEELAREAGLEVPREGGGPSRLVLEGPLDALAAAERFFRARLREHPPAIEYLKRRGVSGETAKLYGIGYAPDRWDALAQHFKDDPRHALAAGLLKKHAESGRLYDVFRNRIMFPIRDTRGRVIAFGGRTLGDDPAKYLNTPETALFHKGRNLFGLYEARQSSKAELPELLVVEGYMDTVMLAQYGVRHVVATLGTATTREHLNLLFKTTSRIVFCFDGDRAGRAAAWRALEQALPELYETREARFMFLPEGHDPDTLVQEEGREKFLARVERAATVSEFLLGELAQRVRLETLDGRARLAALARPYLQRLREGPLRALILDELSRLTRLSRADLEHSLSGAEPRPTLGASRRRALENERGDAPGVRPVKRALQLLLERPELAQRREDWRSLAQADVPGADLLVEALEFFRAHPQCRAHQLMEQWRDTPKAAALQRILGPGIELDPAAAEQEFLETVETLRRSGLRRRIAQFAAQSRTRELSAEELAEWRELTRQLSEPPLV
ncbi:MAG: DNA primase [Sinobacteraceae bacterium]|nr:DNA primase [Nevskiaceae bacterium]